MSHAGQWKPGQSGNPAGRPPGQLNQLREAIAEHIPEILERLVEQAKSGDAQAARILLERVLPPIKATELPVTVENDGGSLVDRANSVFSAASTGALSPSQANALLSGLGAIAKITETDDLQRRVEQLEKVMEKQKCLGIESPR